MSAGHSPLPWTQEVDESLRASIHDAKGRVVGSLRMNGIAILEEDANAAHIVEAVNGYTRLREALESCVSAYETARRDAGCAEDFGVLLDREFPLSDAKAALEATSGQAQEGSHPVDATMPNAEQGAEPKANQ